MSNTVLFKPLGTNKKSLNFSDSKDNQTKIPTAASNTVYL